MKSSCAQGLTTSFSAQGVHVPASALLGAPVVSRPVPNDGSIVPQHRGCKRSRPHVHAARLPHGRLCHHQTERQAMGRLDVLVISHAGNNRIHLFICAILHSCFTKPICKAFKHIDAVHAYASKEVQIHKRRP